MDGSITIGVDLETKQFDKQIVAVERQINEIEKELSANKELGFLSSREVDDLNVQLEKAKNKLIQLRTQQAKVKQGQQEINKEAEKNSLDLSFGKAIKKVGKLTLAIFGVRSAYMLLRRASSELASYDDQYATNLEYIRFVLTQAIAPVLRYIVNLAMQLLQYINMIANAWFGVNLFANGSVEAFNKMKKGAGGVGKAVKEIKKQLLGFDEINVLSDQSDTGTSAGAGGIAPSLDLGTLEGEPPEWLKWITDHKDEILAILGGIATAIALINMGLGIVKSLGIGLIITGIIYAVEGLLKYLENPTFQNLGKIIEGIGLAVIGLGVAFLGLPAVIVGIAIFIYGVIIKYWEEIKGFFQGILDWFSSQEDWVRNTFGDFIGDIYKTAIEYAQLMLDTADSIMKYIKGQFDNLIEFVKAVFTGDWETAWKKLGDIAIAPIEFVKNLFVNVLSFFKNLLDKAIVFLQGKSDWIRTYFGDTIANLYDKFIANLKIASNIFSDWINAIKVHFENIIGFLKNVFTGNWAGAWENLGNIVTNIFGFVKNTIWNLLNALWNVITGWAEAIGTEVGDAISRTFKNVVNSVLGGVEYALNGPIRTINNLIGVINAIPGVNLGKLRTFSLPRLAVGGIVNMPNTGRLVGGAIAGESGREGVVPLTDKQAMAELGREIGRYITVNANIVNTMNGRVISRELKQIQNEQNFAYNT